MLTPRYATVGGASTVGSIAAALALLVSTTAMAIAM